MEITTGAHKIYPVLDGRFRLDGGAMFGVVPKPLWEKEMGCDAKNRIELALRCMLVAGSDRLVLVETGIGGKFDEKRAGIFGIQRSKDQLLDSLGKAGFSREDVTDVIVSHLHFDHAGGATMLENATVVPTFPRAKYWVQQENLDHARRPIEHDRASYLPENFEPLVKEDRLITVDGEAEILPGITVTPVGGHTPGMQLVTVTGPAGSVVFCADLVPTSAHIRVPWNMAYDLHPRRTIDEKKKHFASWAANGTFLFFYHDPVFVGAKLKRDGDAYKPVDRVR